MSGKAQRPNAGQVVGPPNDQAPEYKVEKIVGKRFINGRPQFLVKWEDFPHEDNTWEPMENVGNCMQLVCDFEAELFRRRQNAVGNPDEALDTSPSCSGPLITENTARSSKKTQQRSKPLQTKTKAKTSQMNRKEKENIKKMAGTIKNIQNRPKALKPSTIQIPTPSSTDVSDDKTSTPTKNMIKTPRFHSQFNDLNLSESSDEEPEGATSLNYQQARLPKQKTPTPPKPRGLIAPSQDEDALVASKQVPPVLHREKSQPMQSPRQSDDSDACSSTSVSSSDESSSSSNSSTESSSSSVASFKVAQSKPNPTSLDQITLSSSLPDVSTAGPAAFSLNALKEEARKWATDKRESILGTSTSKPESASSTMGSNDMPQSMALDPSTDNDTTDFEMKRMHSCPAKQQSNWNVPEPLVNPSVEQVRSRQPENRRKSQAGTTKEVAPKQSITTHAPELDSKEEAMTLPGGRRGRTRQDWRMPERKAPFGLDRGLELDEVHHCYQVGEHLFLFVSWKGCQAIDAVPLKDLKEAYPLQIIKYFQSLKIAVPK
ncbi:chromo domain-containing protein cec-1 [Drosophila teissieri]|uniref:chromo domain-containing protein cec-1 n=1 Tax=Drosophila teissieri TaxID=7243 RepID=UPI001CBA5B6C|nr:chromo domain-containing protein cec-1 [Drosophila teissieri]